MYQGFCRLSHYPPPNQMHNCALSTALIIWLWLHSGVSWGRQAMFHTPWQCDQAIFGGVEQYSSGTFGTVHNKGCQLYRKLLRHWRINNNRGRREGSRTRCGCYPAPPVQTCLKGVQFSPIQGHALHEVTKLLMTTWSCWFIKSNHGAAAILECSISCVAKSKQLEKLTLLDKPQDCNRDVAGKYVLASDGTNL